MSHCAGPYASGSGSDRAARAPRRCVRARPLSRTEGPGVLGPGARALGRQPAGRDRDGVGAGVCGPGRKGAGDLPRPVAVELLAQARKTHKRLVVYGLSDHYLEIFQITRLADFMDIFEDETRALSVH